MHHWLLAPIIHISRYFGKPYMVMYYWLQPPELLSMQKLLADAGVDLFKMFLDFSA